MIAMSENKRRPSWILLYFLVALLFSLFVIEVRLTMSGVAHRVVEIGIVLVIYYLVWLWVKANDAAMIQEELDRKRALKLEVLSLVPSKQGLDWSSNRNLGLRQRLVQMTLAA
jgi:hypothetical protein